MNNIFTKRIAFELKISEQAVSNTLQLLEEGCTIPFISRYRKERTGSLDEVQVSQISNLNNKFKDIAKRKETIIRTINESLKMTPELEKRINECWDVTELEDIYLPYKPKRRTKAQIAHEQGLEPYKLGVVFKQFNCLDIGRDLVACFPNIILAMDVLLSTAGHLPQFQRPEYGCTVLFRAKMECFPLHIGENFQILYQEITLILSLEFRFFPALSLY